MNISCKDFNERYKKKDLELQEEYLKQKFGLQKYHHRRLECLDKDITLDENELKLLKTNLEFSKKKKDQNKKQQTQQTQQTQQQKTKNSQQKENEYKQKKENIYKTNKLKKNIRIDRKEIKKICRTKIKPLCKLTNRHKQHLLKKKESYDKQNKKLPQRDLDNLERYQFLSNGIEICRKRNKCDYINLSDIPYDTKFLMDGFKETFITPLFNSLKRDKKNKNKNETTPNAKNKILNYASKPFGDFSKNNYDKKILTAKKKTKQKLNDISKNKKVVEFKQKSKEFENKFKQKSKEFSTKFKQSAKKLKKRKK